MPQKHWDKGRKGKHVGHDDIAAMSIPEILEHLIKWYGVTDLKPTLDITPFNRPPWTTPGDPVIHNVLECWEDGADEFGGCRHYDEMGHFHLSILIKRKDVITLLTESADGFSPGF